MIRIRPNSSTRVCVIGGGAAGLISSQVLKDRGISFQCYEKSAYCGGVWNYWGNTKAGENGNPMYKSLRTNLPREVMPFHSRFRFRDDEVTQMQQSPSSITNTHKGEVDTYLEAYNSKRATLEGALEVEEKGEGGAADSFLSHLEVQCYLERFAQEHDLHQDIAYNTEVLSCTKDKGESQWTVKSRCNGGREEGEGEVSTDVYDHIIVANGHYNRPFVPSLPGMSSYTGLIQHSADYDGPGEVYRGKTVMVVGGRSSATDLAREISTVATRVIVSDRNHQSKDAEGDVTGVGPRGNLYYTGGLERVDDGNTIVAKDGERVEGVDVVVWCTGFLYDFPFLSPPTSGVGEEGREPPFTTNGRKVHGLYEHLFSATDPSLSFVGLPFSIVPFPFFYVQALWIASTIQGDSALPDLHDRLTWVRTHEQDVKERGMDSDSKYHYLGDKQWEYNRRVAGYALSGSEGKSKSSGDGEGEKTKKGVGEVGAYDSLLSFLNLSEAIYNDNSKRRPLLGHPDEYRANKYNIESEQEGRYSVKVPERV